MRRPFANSVAAALAASVVAAALGQPAARPPSAMPPMPPLQPPGVLPRDESKPRPVDQAVADVDALSTSLLVVESGLGLETNFANVYEVPGRPDLLMRRSGAIIAVFPRSEYVGIRGVIRPQIPAGAVFYIGELPASLTGAPAAAGKDEGAARATATLRPASNRVDAPLDQRAWTAMPSAAREPRPPVIEDRDPAGLAEEPTVWTNERYRQRRLAQILDAARTSR